MLFSILYIPIVNFKSSVETPPEPSSHQLKRDEEVTDIINRWTNKQGS